MNIIESLKKNKQLGYFIAFLFMTLPAAGLLPAANHAAAVWIWILIGLVVVGNLIALLLK